MNTPLSRLPTVIGQRLLPFTNPRVVAPPGIVQPNGRRNIVVATPKRSGTHLLIDMILNNVPAYCRSPLYVDLDQCLKNTYRGHSLEHLATSDAGYILKTHVPFETDPDFLNNGHLHTLLDAALVITVRRDDSDVFQSLAKWRDQSEVSGPTQEKQRAFDAFWQFWDSRETLELRFDQLFDQGQMRHVIDYICQQTNSQPKTALIGPPKRDRPAMIHAHKALTRLLGHRAPRIDTTIHTLKG